MVLGMCYQSWITCGITVVATIATLPKKLFCCYLLPAISILCAVGIIILIAGDLTAPPPTDTDEAVVKNLGGPMTIIKMVSEKSKSLLDCFLIGAGISLSLAFINALPFIPLDAGLIWMKILSKLNSYKLENAFAVVGLMCFAFVIIMALSNDFVTSFLQ